MFLSYIICNSAKISARSDNQVAGNLSEKSRKYRQKRTSTNIQITMICWFFEFATGLIAFITTYIMTSLPNPATKGVFALSGMFLDFIIIPSFYLLNTDECKEAITTNGWCNSLKTFILLKRSTAIEQFDLEEQETKRTRAKW